MSGKRTKAMRRLFERVNGRPPERRSMRESVTWAHKSADGKTVVPKQTVITDAHNEFRRFKRAWA